MDGGKCSERYRNAFASNTLEKKHGMEKAWLGKKQMEDELGLEEMKARLAAKTLGWRRNPEDGRFFQFQKLSEKEATWLNKSKFSQVEAAGEATAKDLVSFCWGRSMRMTLSWEQEKKMLLRLKVWTKTLPS